MSKDTFFDDLEKIEGKLRHKNLPNDIELIITYTTGDKDTFEVTLGFWVRSLLGTRDRKKYLYYKGNLINMDQVVKMEYIGLDKHFKAMSKELESQQ